MLLFVFVFYPKQVIPTRVCESVLFYWFFFGYLQIKGQSHREAHQGKKNKPQRKINTKRGPPSRYLCLFGLFAIFSVPNPTPTIPK